MIHEWRKGVRAVAGAVVVLAVATGMAWAQAPAAPAAPADQDWSDSLKQPTDWLKWGADLRLREEYHNNALTLNDDAANHEWDYQRYRARLWGDITPTKNVDLFMRWTWEGFYFLNPDNKETWPDKDVTWDNLYLKLTNPGDLPVVATLGRQDIRFNEGWLIFEGTPLDGSRTVYFDAARFTVDLKDCQSTLDLIYIQQDSDTNHPLPPFNDVDAFTREQDERGAIFYLTNKSVQDTQIDGYFIYKQDRRVLANGDEGEIYTVGTRVAHQFSENIKGRIEGAYQWGQRNNPAVFGAEVGNNVSAFAVNSQLCYMFNDEMKNQIRLSYEFLSGDDPSSKTNEAFDPLWGRWPQWSELYVYTDAPEARIAETSNFHRVAIGWQANPTKKMELSADYHLLFADQNTFANPVVFPTKSAFFSSSGNFRGQLITAVLKYKFDKHLSGHLWAEYFIPGGYYSDARQDAAIFLRAELVLSL